MKLLVQIFILLLLTDGIHSQAPITFCDLLKEPYKYNRQEIRVRATYRYGFEWSELYCLDCLEKGKVWLDTGALDTASERSLSKLPDAGIVNLTVQGTFMTGGTYGHQNGYRYQVTADKITDLKVIQKGIKSPAEAEKAEKRWACGGANPK